MSNKVHLTATAPVQDLAAMQQLLQRWVDRRWLRALDAQLPLTLNQVVAEPQPLVWLLCALLCHQYGRGHSCILLQDLITNPDSLLSLPPQNQYAQFFSDRPSHILAAISLSDIEQALASSHWLKQDEISPLVLADNRLYLHRLYQAEQIVKQQISQRVQQQISLSPVLKQRIEQLFPSAEPSQDGSRETDWQKLACAMALQRHFAIITGGPGTGKTTTVVKLLALIQHSATELTEPEQAGSQRALTIKLAAPTGKAAVRLTESISGAISKLPAQMQAGIPTEVVTLHRLLGAMPNRRQFKHNAEQPLALDVLVVDEASMVDLEMMAALLQALPSHARLILLGDKDQLASVEAGSVLGDLCRGAELGGYLPQTLSLLAPFSATDLSPWQGNGTVLNQATVMLRKSHRFDANSGIGQLAFAVNRGETSAGNLFNQYTDIQLLAGNKLESLKPVVVAGYRHYLQLVQQQSSYSASTASSDIRDSDSSNNIWAKAVLAAYSQFQLLCALRSGDWGIEGLNQQISRWLMAEGLLDCSQQWYNGRPIMMQRNNYSLGLMNGDIGITLLDASSGKLRVVFQLADGSLKWVLPSRLTDIETVFAMTVHKSQGSEFSHCCLVLPPDNSPILSRELLYTGITRAKKQFTLLCGDSQILAQTITKRVSRSSGL
ncbi:exodeoxyribonuclease V subunit alpha [Rheinheimera sp. MMS21-TC3]|uniref:exodeoxyribonuclease V subunit alpha n=1 Tax=Rheinheimera sp. MMS21-TC3 TaxID=3072790 RepID=UPI0028C47067|nr:exodeoxyribonuclease V subunit alpha [Rheinheimera sp. MMS21-TC3]WNO62112.1 exodeoxyribonuclease V subunit alpha [Rheinheimera sp. MMS21-TC3]